MGIDILSKMLTHPWNTWGMESFFDKWGKIIHPFHPSLTLIGHEPQLFRHQRNTTAKNGCISSNAPSKSLERGCNWLNRKYGSIATCYFASVHFLNLTGVEKILRIEGEILPFQGSWSQQFPCQKSPRKKPRIIDDLCRRQDFKARIELPNLLGSPVTLAQDQGLPFFCRSLQSNDGFIRLRMKYLLNIWTEKPTLRVYRVSSSQAGINLVRCWIKNLELGTLPQVGA